MEESSNIVTRPSGIISPSPEIIPVVPNGVLILEGSIGDQDFIDCKLCQTTTNHFKGLQNFSAHMLQSHQTIVAEVDCQQNEHHKVNWSSSTDTFLLEYRKIIFRQHVKELKRRNSSQLNKIVKKYIQIQRRPTSMNFGINTCNVSAISRLRSERRNKNKAQKCFLSRRLISSFENEGRIVSEDEVLNSKVLVKISNKVIEGIRTKLFLSTFETNLSQLDKKQQSKKRQSTKFMKHSSPLRVLPKRNCKKM